MAASLILLVGLMAILSRNIDGKRKKHLKKKSFLKISLLSCQLNVIQTLSRWGYGEVKLRNNENTSCSEASGTTTMPPHDIE